MKYRIMLSEELDIKYTGYRIKLIVAIEKNESIHYKNELLVPILYHTLSEAEDHIKKDISKRLEESMYFRSQRKGYDLVLYSETASANTYLAYRIMPIKMKNIKKMHSA